MTITHCYRKSQETKKPSWITLCEQIKGTRVSTRLRRVNSGLRYPPSSILASSAIHNTKPHANHDNREFDNKGYTLPPNIDKGVHPPRQKNLTKWGHTAFFTDVDVHILRQIDSKSKSAVFGELPGHLPTIQRV